jgi:PhnB protein
MQIQPYLVFNGRCEEAAEFYREKLGAQVTQLMRFHEMPSSENPMIPPGSENKIMHMSLQIGDTHLMMSDGMSGDAAKFEGFSLTLSVPDDAEAQRCFPLLAEGGKITMPLTPTFWSSCFGMLVDRFGVSWMIVVVA